MTSASQTRTDLQAIEGAERFAPLFGSRWRPIRLPNQLDLAELAALSEPCRRTFERLVGQARARAWKAARL